MSCTGCSLNSRAANYLAIDSKSWLDELPDTSDQSDIVEVKFKSTRKEYFRNTDKIELKRGDKVVVSTAPGHDVGEITLTGYLAEKQFKMRIKNSENYRLTSVYRKSTPFDLATLEDSRRREKQVMIRARQIVLELKLEMKIGDVEFRGDGKKAIFYYLADGRIDFRELIKVYSHEFRILIEMKQIGARQEAGIVGGIGSCGRELCCSSWRTNFKTISANAATTQGLSASAIKMTGACGKLKCCLMYELDTYIEAKRDFPTELLVLELAKGNAKPFKTDYLKKEICYVMEGGGGMFYLTLQQVKDIIQKNKRGIKPEIGIATEKVKEENRMEVKLDERLDRFDKNKRSINKKRRLKFTPKLTESGK